MTTRILLCGIIVLSLSMFLASAALAECLPNQVEVTIYNEHSGRITVICVNEAAVEHIGGEGDIVIPATCPCFNYEDVEAALGSDPNIQCWRLEGVTQNTGENCTDIYCGDGTFFWAVEGPEDYDSAGQCEMDNHYIIIGNPNECETQTVELAPISEEEADACIAVLDAIMQTIGSGQ